MAIIFGLIGIVAAIIILFITGVLFIVEQQTVAIVERFGKFVGIARPGLNIKLPFPISVVAKRANLRIIQSTHELGIKTKDNAFIQLPVITQLKVIEDKVVESFYKLNDPINQINSFILNIVRSKAATLDLEEIYTKKNEIAQYVTESLHSKIEDYGYEIIDILVDQPEPAPEVKDAYNSVIASQRALDASRNQAEASKILLIGVAEAEARSLELKAESYGKQRKVISKGLSEALDQMKNKDIDPHYILEFIAGIDYRDTIRDASKHESNTLIFSNNPKEDLQKLLPNLLEKHTTKKKKNSADKSNSENQSNAEKQSAEPVQKDPWEYTE